METPLARHTRQLGSISLASPSVLSVSRGSFNSGLRLKPAGSVNMPRRWERAVNLVYSALCTWFGRVGCLLRYQPCCKCLGQSSKSAEKNKFSVRKKQHGLSHFGWWVLFWHLEVLSSRLSCSNQIKPKGLQALKLW